MTQLEMATALSIREGYLNAILNGRATCSAGLARKIEKVCGYPKEKSCPGAFGEEKNE